MSNVTYTELAAHLAATDSEPVAWTEEMAKRFSVFYYLETFAREPPSEDAAIAHAFTAG